MTWNKPALAATLTSLLLLGAPSRAEEQQGTFWYALDHLAHVERGGEALIWVALPPSWHGQEVEITAIDPEPVAILEDPHEGFNRDLVHGGFFYFGEPLTDYEEVHDLVHMRLASKFFDLGLYEIVEDGCRRKLDESEDGAQHWINLGKVHLHKGEYCKAEASFRRAMGAACSNRDEKLEATIWTHAYLGNRYDLRKQRDLALQEYRQVIALGDNYRGAIDYARRFVVHTLEKTPD